MTATAATSRPALRALLLGGVPPRASGARRAAYTLGLLFGAAMVVASAAIHLHLWAIGYRNIHLIGPSFLFQAVSGFVLGPVLAAYRRLVVVAAAALFLAGSVVALLLSATVGFLGLHDDLSVPWAGWSLATELAGFVVLLACGGLALRRR